MTETAGHEVSAEKVRLAVEQIDKLRALGREREALLRELEHTLVSQVIKPIFFPLGRATLVDRERFSRESGFERTPQIGHACARCGVGLGWSGGEWVLAFGGRLYHAGNCCTKGSDR
jgi:hypothetical protein